MMATNWKLGFAMGVALVAGCVDSGDDKPDVSDVKGGPDGKAEAWGASDNPAKIGGRPLRFLKERACA